MSGCEVCRGDGLPGGCIVCGQAPAETTVYLEVTRMRGMFPPVQRRGGDQ